MISHEFPPDTLGGIGTYARHAASMLAKRGHEVTVFSGTGEAASILESMPGVSVHRLPSPSRQDFHGPAVAALAKEHERSPFDVAEVPDLYAEGRGLRARLPRLPMVLRAHTPLYIPSEIDFNALPPAWRCASGLRRFCGGIAHRQPIRRVWRDALARVSFRRRFNLLRDPERDVALEADIVAPPSRRLAECLKVDWRLPAGKVCVVPYAHIPAANLLALPPPTRVRTIAFHGGIRYFKGVHVLVAAMPIVLARHPDIRLVLAGSSGTSPVPDTSFTAWRQDRMLVWEDTLEWLRPQLDALGDRVTFRGFVPPDRLDDHLREADLCVFPSLFDNFPNACLEAMSSGRPIVATRSGGMEEMLADGNAGLLVEPGDVRGLAEAICRLIEDPALAGRLARAARQRLAAEYSPEVIGPRHEAVYVEAMARRRSYASKAA